MSISISCSPTSFTAQKARKLLMPLQVFVTNPVGVGTSCIVRVTLLSGSVSVPDVFTLPAIPGMWTAGVDPNGQSFVESQGFNPNAGVPKITAFPAFLDPNNPTAPNTDTATFRVEVFDSGVSINFSNVPITVNVSQAQSANVVFVLDHGRGMGNTDSSGTTRLARLKAAFPRGLALLRDDDMLGVTSFGNTTCPFIAPINSALADAGQLTAALNFANNLILDDTGRPQCKHLQDGLNAGRALSPSATVVILTDGTNTLPTPNGISPTAPTSALIFGENPAVAPPTSASLVANGECVVATPQTLGEFAIEKLLTQILVGLTNTTPILDPEGTLEPGKTLRFPLQLTEADHEVQMIVFSNDARPLDVAVEYPLLEESPPSGNGETPAPAPCPCQSKSTDQDVVRGKGHLITRVPVPAPSRDVAPHVVLTRRGSPSQRASQVRFNLIVVAKTDLLLDAQLTASGLAVGSDLLFSAVLTEYGQVWERPERFDPRCPDESYASVRVVLIHPDGGRQELILKNTAPGRYQETLRSFRPGVYTAHFIATGKTLLKGYPFSRECVRTVSIFHPTINQCCPPDPPLPVD